MDKIKKYIGSFAIWFVISLCFFELLLVIVFGGYPHVAFYSLQSPTPDVVGEFHCVSVDLRRMFVTCVSEKL